jgi:mannose-6-phosphate isomerase class I
MSREREAEHGMKPVFLQLNCGVQPYPWGEKAKGGRPPYIADLLGLPAPDGKPFAELWVGAHPNLPATLPDGVKLTDFIEKNSDAVLGGATKSGPGRA